MVSKEASAAMLGIFRQQHYNTMRTHDFPQFYRDCEETGEPELILSLIHISRYSRGPRPTRIGYRI